jgi:hypothetical protein
VATTDDLDSISGFFNFSAADSTLQVHSEHLAVPHSNPGNPQTDLSWYTGSCAGGLRGFDAKAEGEPPADVQPAREVSPDPGDPVLIGSTNGQHSLPCVQGVEDASSTQESSYSQTVDHWAWPCQELAASNTRRSSRDGVKFCKEAKPLSPMCISDTNDALATKRARNTLAARKSRQRKTARFEALEKRIVELEAERDQWKGIALRKQVNRVE